MGGTSPPRTGGGRLVDKAANKAMSLHPDVKERAKLVDHIDTVTQGILTLAAAVYVRVQQERQEDGGCSSGPQAPLAERRPRGPPGRPPRARSLCHRACPEAQSPWGPLGGYVDEVSCSRCGCVRHPPRVCRVSWMARARSTGGRRPRPKSTGSGLPGASGRPGARREPRATKSPGTRRTACGGAGSAGPALRSFGISAPGAGRTGSLGPGSEGPSGCRPPRPPKRAGAPESGGPGPG